MIYQPKAKSLNHDEVAARIKIIRKSKSDKKILQAKEDLWLAVYRVIMSVAASYDQGRGDMEELVQAGSHGTMVAIDRFDVSKNVPFRLYAFHYIRKFISAHCYETRYPVTGRKGVRIETVNITSDYLLNKFPVQDIKSKKPLDDFYKKDLLNKIFEEVDKMTELQRECLMIFFYGTKEQKNAFHKKHGWGKYVGMCHNKDAALKKLQDKFKKM